MGVEWIKRQMAEDSAWTSLQQHACEIIAAVIETKRQGILNARALANLNVAYLGVVRAQQDLQGLSCMPSLAGDPVNDAHMAIRAHAADEINRHVEKLNRFASRVNLAAHLRKAVFVRGLLMDLMSEGALIVNDVCNLEALGENRKFYANSVLARLIKIDVYIPEVKYRIKELQEIQAAQGTGETET